MSKKKYIGFTCAYTPLQILDAAGFTPYRILPIGDPPDRAGQILHDNLCPNIKRILDRALDRDVPPLEGMVFVNSCDAMRRLADAWRRIRPRDRVFLIDLPVTTEEHSISFLKDEIARLTGTLGEWSGNEIATDDIEKSIKKYNRLAALITELNEKFSSNNMTCSRKEIQAIFNRAVTEPIDSSIEFISNFITENDKRSNESDAVPVYIFGNVLPDPEIFSFFESCGAKIVSDDLCTGSRMIPPVDISEDNSPFYSMAKSLLMRTPCLRTMDNSKPHRFGEDIVQRAKARKVSGMIGHTVKFCDPYLLRLPAIRETALKEELPILLLEGDCTMRSIGQHRTRIEAFIEMLR